MKAVNTTANSDILETDQFDESQIDQPFAMKLFILLSKKKMANCFDFRLRTTSFDLHQLSQRHKIAKLGKLFRSQSEGNVKSSSPKQSPKQSPKGSPTGVVRRRFVRVVRNEESPAEEYENPHVIRRYTQEYLQEQWEAQRASDSFDEDNLPYTVSGHTILKKHSSGERTESQTGDQSPLAKHTSFKEEVEVIEFNKKDKIKMYTICTHTERLQDSDEEISNDICDACLKRGSGDCPHVSSESEMSDSDVNILLREKRKTHKITVKVLRDDVQMTDRGDSDETTDSISKKDCHVESIVNKLVDLDLNERTRSTPTAVLTHS